VRVIHALLVLVAAAASVQCVDSDPAAGCAQYNECVTCVMEAACGFCLETNACIADVDPCPGDRAQSTDMCEEEH
jgi:hypothetical protein